MNRAAGTAAGRSPAEMRAPSARPRSGATPADNLAAAYPEIGAGGFSRVDGSIEFYGRINALIAPDMTVLDIGAGRGAQLMAKEAPYRTGLATLRGKVRRLVGVDVDAAVMDNAFVDEAHIVDAEGPLPFADASFDLIYADWVLEHVQDPAGFAREVGRTLVRGGWFCARTPNRWGMTGIGTNLLPNRAHAGALRILQPGREAQDVFPTVYRLNTKRRLRRHFGPEAWEDFTYFYNAEPPYVQRSRLAIRLVKALFRIAPDALATNLHVFMRKR